jgi:hypothetical protein
VVWLESVYRRTTIGRGLSVSKLKSLAAKRHNVTAEWFGRRRKRRKRDVGDPLDVSTRNKDELQSRGLGQLANALARLRAGGRGRGLLSQQPSGSSYGREPKQSVQMIRVLKPPFDEDWVWYPRRICCKSVTLLEEDTVAEIRLGPCTINETIWKESVVAEGHVIG